MGERSNGDKPLNIATNEVIYKNNLHPSIINVKHIYSRRVSFADDSNLPLVYIMPEDELAQVNVNGSFESIEKLIFNKMRQVNSKVLIQQFEAIDELKAFEKFDKDKVCLHSIEAFQNGTIKGRIYTKIQPPMINYVDRNQRKPEKNSGNSKLKKLDGGIFNFFKRKNKKIDKTIHIDIPKEPEITNDEPVEVVYVIWSIDKWKTWKTQEAYLIEQSGNHRVYVFSIENIFDIVKAGDLIQLAACHQVGNDVKDDTNDKKFYCFQCAEKL